MILAIVLAAYGEPHEAAWITLGKEKGIVKMNIHEFGKENNKIIVLIHPSVVMWDYFEYVIPRMQKDYHLIVPALPGYDPDEKNDFTSVEEIADDLAGWLIQNNMTKVDCVYGCSMGGSIVIRLLLNHRLRIDRAVIDGGITPYQLPYLITRFIAIKDFLMISIGKFGGIKLLEKAFSTDELSEDDVQYTAKVLSMISYRTIWNTFDSCNNYKMPEKPWTVCKKIEYWCADAEIKDRKLDIRYMKKNFPQTKFKLVRNTGHGGLAPFQPERLVKGLLKGL